MTLKSILECRGVEVKKFSCGNKNLDVFLKCYARFNDENGYGKTFVLEKDKKVIGFFALCSAQVKFDELPNNNKAPRYPIPSIRIARLAVDKNMQGHGYGKYLIREAFIKIVEASKTIGISIVVVDAKESSLSFYEQYGFKKLLNNNLTYCLKISDIKAAM